MSKIKVELEAISEFRYQLLDLLKTLDETVQQVNRAILEESQRLENIRSERAREVDLCRSAYISCRSAVDDEGRPPPCTNEYAAWKEAENKLEEVKAQIVRFQTQSEQLISRITYNQESLQSSIENGRSYLDRHIHEALVYLKGHDVAIPETTGQDPHGSEYQRARRRFFRELSAGDYRNEPSHLRGWVTQEINRGGYYHSPSGYDVGHYVRNLNIPENFRFEASSMNRGRAGIARRYNLQNF